CSQHPSASISSLSYFLFCFLEPSADLPHLHSFPTRRSSDLKPGFIQRIRMDGHLYVVSLRDTQTGVDRSRRRAPVFVQLQSDRRSEEHTSELQSRFDLVCRLLLEKKNTHKNNSNYVLQKHNQ